MKKLYIGRHAKSGWDYLNINDIDRVLSERGISDAYIISSSFLKDKRELPEIIYSSPATRAIHTAIIFSRISGYTPEKIKMISNLYAASEMELLKEIQTFDDKYTTAMIFGHNEGLTNLINLLISDEPIDNLPTAAIAGIIFQFDCWRDHLN
jgi:phosphohistidine phosphatase